LAELADELGFETSGLDARAPRHEALIAVAGLVSFADWIASDAFRFPVTAGPRAPSRLLAEMAVDSSAWSAPPAPPPATFLELFERPPRATQAAVGTKLDELEPGEPSLVLVEDRTGAGKTEAAFLVAHRALRGGARGLYVGMPTRATARQLHERTARFLRSLWTETQVAVRLLHGGAVADADEPVPSEVERDDRDPAGATAEAQQWFAQSRRGLLAPFAVGTIDQALLAILNARHYQVRVWGLQGKVVVLDEVHAYDAYTGLLLERLVEWLAALDCTVVLLSATLPPRRRAALLQAFAGASTENAAAGGYPRVSVAKQGQVVTTAVEDDRPGRAVLLRRRAGADDPHAVATFVLDQVRDGGCAALVCSTVAEAQERWAAVRALDPHLDCVLVHARVRPVERAQIERRLLDTLGPPGDRACARPERLVVVATQVIEQSLDLDFDVMLSDLAPIDLLIQRAGRVHRHAGRERPIAHAQPRLTIFDATGDDPLRSPPASAGAVYVRSILLRTRLVLGARPALREPDDLDELIATTYEAARSASS
jgi:CRISPR-associated endonuclease/helicase Cas3